MTERTALAQKLWELKTGTGLSLSKMVAPAGDLLSVSTLHAVMHGNTRDLEPDTVNGLALILDVSPGHVLALLDGREFSDEELKNEEKEKLWAMYSDIPRQCQQDVLDLLAVLQRNHSVSARRMRHQPRRAGVAAAQAASGSNTPRHPAVTNTPADVPLPETTPQVSDDEAEGEERREGRAANKNGTNGEE
jgi:hypothetical protein